MSDPLIVFFALGEPKRYAILDVINTHPDLSVGAIREKVGGTLALVSQALMKLRAARLVVSRTSGKQRHYTCTPLGQRMMTLAYALVVEDFDAR